MIEQLERLLRPLKLRLLFMVRRAVISLVSDALPIQGVQLQLLAGEVHDGVERLQQYGFTSVPKPGAEAIMVSVGGSRNLGVVIAVDDRRYRLKGLPSGEVAIYTDEGDHVHLKRGRKIEMLAGTEVSIVAPEVKLTAATKVTVTSPLLELSGSLTVAGAATITGAMAAAGAVSSATGVSDPSGTMAGFKAKYNAHKHSEHDGPNTSVTDQPIP